VAIRRFLTELFRRSHFLLSLVGTLSLWRHLSLKRLVSRFFVLAGFCLWGGLVAASQLIWIYHNFRFGRNFPRTTVTPMVDASLFTLVVPRPWSVRTDQYVYLLIPGVSISRGYAFMVAWWEESESSVTLYLLAEDRGGFSHKIRTYVEPVEQPAYPTVDESLHHRRPPIGLPFHRNVSTQATEHSSSLLTLFHGPYGLQHDFGSYGTLVMVATGDGIASMLPHIKVLLERNLNHDVCTRRIMLFWQIEKEGNPPFLCRSS
jgi:hypothetical protein